MDYAISLLIKELATLNNSLNQLQAEIETGCSKLTDIEVFVEGYRKQKEELEQALVKLGVF